MWSVRFTEAARAELIDAQDWYEAEAPGLGRRFRAEIESVVQRMANNPRQFPVVFKAVRRARAKKISLRALFSHRGRCPPRHSLFSRQPRPAAVAKASLTLYRPISLSLPGSEGASSLFM